MRYEIPCSECNAPTGAVLVGGDPFLPCIVCTECADKEEEKERESGNQ